MPLTYLSFYFTISFQGAHSLSIWALGLPCDLFSLSFCISFPGCPCPWYVGPGFPLKNCPPFRVQQMDFLCHMTHTNKASEQSLASHLCLCVCLLPPWRCQLPWDHHSAGCITPSILQTAVPHAPYACPTPPLRELLAPTSQSLHLRYPQCM